MTILNSREVDDRDQHHKWQPLSLEAPLKSFWEGDPRASCTVQSTSGLDEEGKELKSPQEGRSPGEQPHSPSQPLG